MLGTSILSVDWPARREGGSYTHVAGRRQARGSRATPRGFTNLKFHNLKEKKKRHSVYLSPRPLFLIVFYSISVSRPPSLLVYSSLSNSIHLFLSSVQFSVLSNPTVTVPSADHCAFHSPVHYSLYSPLPHSVFTDLLPHCSLSCPSLLSGLMLHSLSITP